MATRDPMATSDDEHQRTMAFAEIALERIKSLRQPATPRNFEIWYAYATGFHPSLNQSVNETIKRAGTLDDLDIDRMFSNYLSPTRQSERIDEVGGRVLDEIEQIMSLVDATVYSASKRSESLAGVSRNIPGADRDALRGIVASLIQTAKEIEDLNHNLESRLTASKHEIAKLQETLEVVRNESLTDPLTSLANRKFFDQSLSDAISEAISRNEPISLLMTDIDHFKTFNDTYGHVTGDHVLRLVAACVKQNVKGQDIAARYGGEEFAIILPNTGLSSADTLANQIRRAVMSKNLVKRSTGEHLGRVTISIGVATLNRSDSPQSLIDRADTCLYAAKHAGRNRVICEADPEVSAVPKAVA
jgi:diguanylate cyclase